MSGGAETRWDRWALLAMLCLLLPCYFLMVTPRVTSDPVGYVVYAQTLAEGDIFVDMPAAELVFENGGSFPESVFHGYLFQNADEQIYPFFSAGFPVFLTGFVALFGPVYAPLFNLLLLPFLLWLYAVIIRKALHGEASWCQRWVPVMSVGILYFWFRPHLACWSMTYREVPSLVLGFAGVALLLRPAGRPLSWARLVMAGVFVGLSVWVRETSVGLLAPCSLLVLWQVVRSNTGAAAGKKRGWVPTGMRVVVAGVFLGIGSGIGMTPHLVTNWLYRGSVVGHQVDATTQDVIAEHTNEEGGVSTAGLKLTNLQEMLPIRLQVFGGYLKGWVFFLLLGSVAALRKKSLPLALFCLPPALLYLLLYSAFNIPPPVHRYDFMIYLFLVPLMGLGVVCFVRFGFERLERVTPLRFVTSSRLAFVLVGLLVASYYVRLGDPQRQRAFGYGDLIAFQELIQAHVPPRSIVLSELPARDYVQALTGSNAVSLHNLRQVGMDAGSLIAACERKGIPLFYLKTGNRDPGSTPFSTAELMADLARVGHLELLFSHTGQDPVRKEILGTSEVGLFRISSSKRKGLPPLRNMVGGAVRVELSGTRLGDAVPMRLDPLPQESPQAVGEYRRSWRYPKGLPLNLEVAPVDPQVNLPDAIQVVTVPDAAAHRVLFGQTGADHAWLPSSWFKDGRPTLSGDGYRFTSDSPVRMDAWKELFSESFCVLYEYSNPWIFNSPQELRVEPADGRTLLRVAYGERKRPVGLLVTGARAEQDQYLANTQRPRPLMKSMAAGEQRAEIVLPLLPNVASDPWAVWVVPNGGTLPVRQVVVSLPSGVPASVDAVGPAGITARSRDQGSVVLLAPAEHMLLLWRPLTLTYGPKENWVRSIEASHLFGAGFGRIFPDGRWTEERARLVLPPAVLLQGGTIELDLASLRPKGVPRPTVRIWLEGKELQTVTVQETERVTISVPARPSVSPFLPALEIESETWVPADWSDSKDRRALGVVVSSCTVRLAGRPDPQSPSDTK